MLKMATYPGMSLSGEVRESISLDEDDLSDVEDEVFIRDGKNGYKLAEDLNAKRPLMAPRRKPAKPVRLKAKPPCRALCRPCCYIFAALSVLIGLIVLVVVLVSIFPLPLDRVRLWLATNNNSRSAFNRAVPCSDLKVTDIWATSLPVLSGESPLRSVDLDGDGVDDVLFGFGVGENGAVLEAEVFCPVFMGVAPPCEGGVIALNGSNGEIVWRYWTNDTIFGLQCNADLDLDGQLDCLAVGFKGSLVALNTKNGSVIWSRSYSTRNIYVANFIPDQNNDSVVDILASHSDLVGKEGHLVLISGKTGAELKRVRTPEGARTFFMPQLHKNSSSSDYLVIFGTGTPDKAGNLSVAPLKELLSGNYTAQTLYSDPHKGILTQSILVDITGDLIPDIVTSMYNSTIVAIDGRSFAQLWNYTVPNSETNVTPTPAYFNDDNVTDFLVIYSTFDNILNYNYTVTYIIDGRTGKPIYERPITGAVSTQMAALALTFDNYGFDMFLFWTTECTNVEFDYNKNKKQSGDLVLDPVADVCRQQFNTTNIMKLNALNQYDQPPGFVVYNSANRTALEFNNTKSPWKRVREYYTAHPKLFQTGQSESEETYIDESQPIGIPKYGTSSFRHKDNKMGIIKDYMRKNQESNQDYDVGVQSQDDDNMLPDDYDNIDDQVDTFNQRQMLYDDGSTAKATNRDPRSKQSANQNKSKRLRQSPETKYGVYSYKNIKMSRSRLLHDLDNLPSEILMDTYFKNRESQLRKSRFEQRDINSHVDKMKENQELKRIIEKEKKEVENSSLNLWDLESEREVLDRSNGYWRGKRQLGYYGANGVRKVTSVGAVVKSFNSSSNNSIDVIFITYWQPLKLPEQEARDQEIIQCTEEKLANASEDQNHKYQKTTSSEQRALFQQECLSEQLSFENDLRYSSKIYQLSLGQMTVYRLRLECQCEPLKSGETCAKFLPREQQNWPMYLGRRGDGAFH